MSMSTSAATTGTNPGGRSPNKPVTKLSSVSIRFAGDSGDGMQMAGSQFGDTSALVGNDISTFPDYPAEIRAPAGTVAGVSGFQIQFSSSDIFTPGDEVDALVAMNPAALKTNLKFVKSGGIVIVNEDAFTENEIRKAGYPENPLNQPMSNYRVIKVPINKLNELAVKDTGLATKQIDRCKNFFALGLAYWLYGRPLEPTLAYIEEKFGAKLPAVARANSLTLKAGYNFGETSELFDQQYHVDKAKLPPGTYRKVTGNEAVALGMVTAAELAGRQLFYGSYPITPASDILHTLSELKQYRVITFQAEDEICAMGATIGAAFGGALAATGTSGPGAALKTEGIGLAVMVELPMVVVNVQRGGPSTGLPTKTEQADLFQAILGRNGECPLPVIAAASPSDCFAATIEAFRIAVRYMTPVVLLTDGYIGNSAEPWLVPDVSNLEKIMIENPTQPNDPKGFLPYKRNEDGARPWAIPGAPGLEHRIGGLEKADLTGMVSYDPANHDLMINLRAKKIAGIRPAGAPYFWTGQDTGDLLIVSWGGTFGHTKQATLELQKQGLAVAACHLRYLNPLPADLGEKLRKFTRVLVCEINLGQLRMWLRANYLVDAKGFNKVRGQPFVVHELVEAAKAELAAK